MSGAEGIQAERMQRFAEELRERYSFPSIYGMSA